MQRKSRNWADSMTDEDILNSTFTCGYLLQSNNHPLLVQIRKLVLADYLVKAKFTYLGYNGEDLWCNGQRLAKRVNKSWAVQFADGVKLIEGKPLAGSGSNKYPTVRFENNYCILEFISNGLPVLNKTSGWAIEVLEIVELKP